ncbi:MAG: hypothetical protein AAF411_01745 [Myxococcota bacterium]
MRTLVGLVVLLIACGDSSSAALISLRTDYAPIEDFSEVRLVLSREPSSGTDALQTHSVTSSNYARGVQVGSFEDLSTGPHRLRLELIDEAGVPVARRAVVFNAGELLSVTVVVTSECEGVVCPASDPALTECAGGRCVDPRCTPESPENCASGCIADEDCTPAVSCLSSECTAEGTCLASEAPGACGGGERCDRVVGCVPSSPQPDASVPVDAASVDAAVDAAPDADPRDEGVEGPVDPLDAGCDGSSCCACDPAQVDTRSCGNCGVQTRVCGGDCRWGAWGACSGEGVCDPGSTEEEACGRCGTRGRACNASCGWDAWSACSGEGVCSAGSTESCGGTCQARTCSDSCEWGACTECTCTATTECGTSCAEGFHAEQRFCRSSCSGRACTGSINAVRCEPNCGTQFTSCSSTCPSGYYASARFCTSRCGGDGFCTAGSNALTCRMVGASSISACGLVCPNGYSRTGSVCIARCGDCRLSNNGSSCRLN